MGTFMVSLRTRFARIIGTMNVLTHLELITHTLDEHQASIQGSLRILSASAYSAEEYHLFSISIDSNSTITTARDVSCPSAICGSAPRTK